MGGETNAMTRTTVAITTLEGSAGANVLAATARANANIRVAVGESVEGTVERLRRIIRDPKVELRVVEGNGPSPVSPHSGAQWELLAGCIAGVFAVDEKIALETLEHGVRSYETLIREL